MVHVHVHVNILFPVFLEEEAEAILDFSRKVTHTIHHVDHGSSFQHTKFLLDYGKYQSGDLFRMDIAAA